MQYLNQIKFYIISFIILALSASCDDDNENILDDNEDKGSIIKGSFTDPRDEIVYETVTIGNQVWMAENLKYLPDVVDVKTGSNTDPYYYVYSYSGTNLNDAKSNTNYSTYGVLYNWPAAKNSCPDGWHLPTDAEWTTLINYLGGEAVAGGKMKEDGSNYWSSPNTGATNDSGFTALPGGARGFTGSNFDFAGLGRQANWWSATENSNTNASYWIVNFGTADIGDASYRKEMGNSVRCVKD